VDAPRKNRRFPDAEIWRVPHGRTRNVLGAVMTTALTITGRVAELHATMAAQPPNEAMGAFRREQAARAATSTDARFCLPVLHEPE
jgi:hypothetical protein